MISSAFVSARELAELLEQRAPSLPVVLDASYLLRRPEFDGDYRAGTAERQWLSGHIPGSRYVDIQRQFSDPAGATHYTHPPAQAIADELARLGVAESAPVVVYDTTQTIFAARLWYLLRWIGVDARVLDGGLEAWRAAGLPLESGPAAPPTPAAAWTVTGERAAWVTRNELVARSVSDDRPLVCGLPASNFSGADHTRYSRRGHIPGSVNVSARDLFAADGTVLAAAELRDAYVSEGITGDQEVLLYCGGGISAAANALTLGELGITAVRIYDGSLEEWSADGSLPLEVG